MHRKEKQNSRKRRTLFFSLLLCFLVLSAYGYAQNAAKKVSLTCKEMPLSEALTQLERQSDYKLNFNYDELKQLRVSANIKNKTMVESVNILLTNLPFKASVNGKFINITKVKTIFQKKQPQIKSTNGNVIGQVLDTDGTPLIGVTVRIKGTNEGALTDSNGDFSISVDEQNVTLLFTYIGKKDLERSLHSGRKVTITLEDAINALDNVVVTGFQTIERGRATGSYDILKEKDLKIIPSSNFMQKLEGLVPGLLIKADGSLEMRGKATLYANSQPLIVVDGFPMEYDNYNINPNDIEQISVLKDAASASIWGVRAANGVIVITTKSGHRNEGLSISYNGMVRITAMKDLDSYHRMSSSQLWDANYELYKQGYIIDINNPYPIYDEGGKLYYQLEKNILSKTQFDSKVADLISYDNLADIKKIFYRTPVLQQHNLVLTNSSQRSSTYLSVNYENGTFDTKDNKESKIGFQFN